MPDDLETDDVEPENESAIIRDLRRQVEDAKADKTRADNAERMLTLHEAGLGGLSEKQRKALTAAHDGEWEPEAIKATANDLGFAAPPADTPDQPKTPQEELDAMQRMQDAGGVVPPPGPADGSEAARIAAITEASDADLDKVLANLGMLPVDS